MIEHLKNYLGNFVLRNMIKAKKGQNKFVPFDNAKDIGILYFADSIENENKVQQFASELRNEGKKVFLMGFVNAKQLPGRLIPQINNEYYWKERLTFFNLPDNEKIGQFSDNQFDILFSVYFEENIALQGLSVLSKAKYKLGTQMNLATQIFDMTIDTGGNKDLYYLAKQMEFYLKAL